MGFEMGLWDKELDRASALESGFGLDLERKPERRREVQRGGNFGKAQVRFIFYFFSDYFGFSNYVGKNIN